MKEKHRDNGWAVLYEFVCDQVGPGMMSHEKKHLRLLLKVAWDRMSENKNRKADLMEELREMRGSFH
tara:strand:+ start:1338 stop:1538 length:201 start_codon:yes stop_codon:yes gene_type:complete